MLLDCKDEVNADLLVSVRRLGLVLVTHICECTVLINLLKFSFGGVLPKCKVVVLPCSHSELGIHTCTLELGDVIVVWLD